MNLDLSLLSVGSIAILVIAGSGCSETATGLQIEVAENTTAYALAKDEGEVLLDRKGRTNIIKISPLTGSENLAMGTQSLPAGSGILVHKHDHTEELLYVTDGTGTALLGEEFLEVTADTKIWVPPGTWHGIENPDSDMHVIWVVTPPGLDGFMRGISWPIGAEPKQLTIEQIREIEAQHDSVTRQQ